MMKLHPGDKVDIGNALIEVGKIRLHGPFPGDATAFVLVDDERHGVHSAEMHLGSSIPVNDHAWVLSYVDTSDVAHGAVCFVEM